VAGKYDWKRGFRQYAGMIVIGAIIILAVYLLYTIAAERIAMPLPTRH